MLDPLDNPYTPGAGRRPHELAGREREQNQFRATLRRLVSGRGAPCLLIIGLRGVGKTVLLNRFAQIAREDSWVVVEHEFDAKTDLVGTVTRLAREALLEIAPASRWDRVAQRTARALRGLTVTYELAGISISKEFEAGVGDSGDLARDLTDLLVSLAETAQRENQGVVMLFDELQYAAVEPLGALVTALHKVAQRDLPLTVVGAGLPQLRGVLAEAKSYAERLFTVVEVGPLTSTSAREALVEPAEDVGVTYENAAVEHVVSFTEGYPFFLQTYGDHIWNLAAGPEISAADAEIAEGKVRDALDEGFFRFRTDRLSVRQRRYLRAMAEHGAGEISSGDVARTLGMKSSTEAGRTREELIQKGLIYSPRLGHAAFTVPQFDDYLRRHFELETHTPKRRKPSTPRTET